MAAGDIVADSQSISNGNYMDIQPGAGAEWVIQNVSWGGAVEMYTYDGTNSNKCDSDTTFGGRFCMNYLCNNTDYYRIKNVSGGDIIIHYDGRVLK